MSLQVSDDDEWTMILKGSAWLQECLEDS